MFSVLRSCVTQALLAFGAICGLVLVTLCGWVITSEAVWNYFQGVKEVPAEPTGSKWLLMYIGGGLLYGINSVLSGIYNLFNLRVHIFGKILTNTNYHLFHFAGRPSNFLWR